MTWGSNVFPLLIVTSSGGFTGLFVYSPAPGAGNLIASIAAQAGTDPYGNHYPQGITSYGSTIEGIFDGSTLSWQALSSPFNVEPAIAGVGNSVSGADLSLSSGQATPSSTTASMDLEDSVRSVTGASLISMRAAQTNIGPVAAASPATTAQLEVQGTTALKNETAPAAVAGWVLPFAIGGNLAFVNGLAGDNNIYDTGTLHFTASPAFSVSAIAFPNPVTGVTVPVGIGHYRFRCVINATGTVAAGTPQLEFTFPSLSGTFMQNYATATGVATVQVNQAAVSAVTSVALAVGPILNGHGFICTWEGDFTTTAAGNLQLGAITSNAADTYTIANVWLDLYPVN